MKTITLLLENESFYSCSDVIIPAAGKRTARPAACILALSIHFCRFEYSWLDEAGKRAWENDAYTLVFSLSHTIEFH